jgi:hypothetical protein
MSKDLYSNTKYNFDREDSKTIILDIPITDLNVHTFTKNLEENLTVDVHSDIYLDSITTYNCVSSSDNSSNMGFILNIDEFEVKSVSNEGKLGRSIFIPNEQSGTQNVSKSHKGKKLNYICSINPTNINRISGKITNIDGGTAFHTGGGRLVAEFVIVSK